MRKTLNSWLWISIVVSLSGPCVQAAPSREFPFLDGVSAKVARKDEVYQVRLEKLHPTQFAVGMGEVKERMKKIAAKDEEDYEKYLRKKIGRVVIGPDATLWLIDGHHLATALSKLRRKIIYLRVEANLDKSTAAEFERMMIQSKWCWLYDGNGQGPLSFSQLPSKILDLQDDPYRTLAWKVSHEEGFKETTIPFAEFMWGQYYRKYVTLAELNNDFEKAVERATLLSFCPQASKLPGYTQPARVPKACPQ
jgi:hypothetical protein